MYASESVFVLELLIKLHNYKYYFKKFLEVETLTRIKTGNKKNQNGKKKLIQYLHARKQVVQMHILS